MDPYRSRSRNANYQIIPEGSGLDSTGPANEEGKGLPLQTFSISDETTSLINAEAYQALSGGRYTKRYNVYDTIKYIYENVRISIESADSCPFMILIYSL